MNASLPIDSSAESRERCAAALQADAARISQLTAFVGLDGFVDEIVHVVDTRSSATTFQRMETITALAERLQNAAGHSTNLELVTQQAKLGGNGPIMANALATLGLHVTCLGPLGHPRLHPVFEEFSSRAELHSLGEPAHTDALEFADGKLMFGKLTTLEEITWENIQERFGTRQFAAKFRSSALVALVNWTMIPHMSEIWEAILRDICPALPPSRRILFFDLADPEKRTRPDLAHALELIASFRSHFDVVLGLNEKEAQEVGDALGLPAARSPEELAALAREIARRVPVQTLVVHPVSYALAVTGDQVAAVAGPAIAEPLITTGAGDHFNSGFCLGKLLGLDNGLALLLGVGTSGYYVAHARSPDAGELAGFLRRWPAATQGS